MSNEKLYDLYVESTMTQYNALLAYVSNINPDERCSDFNVVCYLLRMSDVDILISAEPIMSLAH